jgi:hypothetical protein
LRETLNLPALMAVPPKSIPRTSLIASLDIFGGEGGIRSLRPKGTHGE